LQEAFAAQDDFTAAALEALFQKLAAERGRQTADYVHPCRLAVSGVSVGPSLYGMLEVLGRERVTARIARFLVG
jgi:glutamyl-tRNA synthetase